MKAPRSQKIASDLEKNIQQGNYAEGVLLPTERELQAKYGVSRGTIRRAFAILIQNGWAESSPNRGVIARMGQPTHQKNIVGFVDDISRVNQQLFFALNQALQSHGYHLVHVDSQTMGTEAAIEQCCQNGFAAAIVWSKRSFPKVARLENVQKLMPIIAIDHSLNGVSTDLVTCDNHEGAREAVSHLIRMGRRKIAISGMFDNLDAHHERFTGYMQAHIDNEVPLDSRNFLFSSTSGMPEQDTSLLGYRLRQTDRPDAVFVLQEIFAPEVIAEIEKAGLSVPEDVSVIGFGDDLIRGPIVPNLTTVAIDWAKAAEVCFERIIGRLKYPHAPVKRTSIPVRLIIRGSCGAKADPRMGLISPVITSKSAITYQ